MEPLRHLPTNCAHAGELVDAHGAPRTAVPARPESVAAHWGFAVALALIAVACSSRPVALPMSWSGEEVTNYHRIEDGLATANAITVAAVPALAAAGFKTIIDLRAPSERGVAEEAVAAERAGLRYVNIPVTLPTLTGESVRKVADVIDQSASRPVLMHCASGNRVGAVMELYRETIHGVPHEAAHDEAHTIGLQAPEWIDAVDRVRLHMGAGR
jgi:uncharacterized protein (TIGR01244 family)